MKEVIALGKVEEKDTSVDVICQHRRDGSIIPIKLRIEDDNGEFQTYQIRAYKDLKTYGEYTMPNYVTAKSAIHRFECKVVVFNEEKRIFLYYNTFDNKWRVSFDKI